jgi:hypothetical protein
MSAWTRGSVKRRPAARCVSTVMGVVTARKESSPIRQSWLSDSTCKQPSVGSKADLSQRRQIAERTTDLEIVGVVDGGFGAKGLTFFMVLLDPGLLVLNIHRGHDSLSEHARAEASGRATGDAPSKISCI